MSPELRSRFEQETRSHTVVLYMKGNALFPQCGFSARALEILKAHGPVHVVDVLSDPAVREGIKEYSSWPTIPQIYIRGQFVGGSDIVAELQARGELAKMINA